MSGKMLSPEIIAELDRLDAMAEEDIDLVDIPEAPASNWATARRPGLRDIAPPTVPIPVDREIVDWFEKAGPGYQQEINRILRRHFLARRNARKTANG